MKMPSQEKGPQTFVDEQQRHAEFSRYEEVRSSRELYKNPELFRSDELQEPARQAPPKGKNKASHTDVRLLSQYLAGVTTVTATAAVAVAAIFFAKPSFEVRGEDIGLHSFRCTLRVEDEGDLSLNAYLTEKGGELIEKMAIDERGELVFEELQPETPYVVSVRDEQGEEYFTYSFTTDPFITFTELEEGGALLITLHEDFSEMTDITFELFDSEGKSFRDNIYSVVLNEDELFDSSYDSATDPPPQLEIAYYLSLEGLYTDEYTLQFVDYRTDEGELYEKKLQLGDLQALSYEPSVDVVTEEITLRYLSGDSGLYQPVNVELYQGDSYCGYAEATVDGDGNVTFPRGETWESGSYTLYLIGEYQADGNYFYNQIWKGELVLE